MSHITKAKAKILDLDCLKESIRQFKGATWVEGQRTFRWFGKFIGDSTPPAGMNPADFGKCSHVIRLDGCSYDIGVVQQLDGSYELHFDYWGPGGNLVHVFGKDLFRLQNAYAEAVCEKAAVEQGYMTEWRQNEEGERQLVCTQY